MPKQRAEMAILLDSRHASVRKVHGGRRSAAGSVSVLGGRTMRYWKKILLPGLVGGLVVLASAMPAGAAGDGPLNTPLAPFTDGSLGKYLWTVPGVIKKQGFVTDFTCTNLDAPGTAADIGVEIFDA